MRKKVTNGVNIKTTDYLDGFQYNEQVLEFFPTTEGYVKATPVGNANPDLPPTGYAYNYTFNYTDHLGNIRLSYTKDPQSGTLQILEENHYYPFGLRHEIYVTGSKRQHGFGNDGGGGDIDDVELINVLRTDYQYKFGAKEWQDELGLNFYDYGARNYDPALGRWMNPDPLAEMFMDASPYNYALNNPIFFIDPDGMEATINVGYDREVAFDSFSGSVQASYFDLDKPETTTENSSNSGDNKTGALSSVLREQAQKKSQGSMPDNGYERDGKGGYKQINNEGGDETDYLYENGKKVESTPVKTLTGPGAKEGNGRTYGVNDMRYNATNQNLRDITGDLVYGYALGGVGVKLLGYGLKSVTFGKWAFSNKFIGGSSSLFGRARLGSFNGNANGIFNRHYFRLGWSWSQATQSHQFLFRVGSRYGAWHSRPFIQIGIQYF